MANKTIDPTTFEKNWKANSDLWHVSMAALCNCAQLIADEKACFFVDSQTRCTNCNASICSIQQVIVDLGN